MAAVEMISDCVTPTAFWFPVNARNADPAPTYWVRKERVNRLLAQSGFQLAAAGFSADVFASRGITVGPSVVATPHRPPTVDVAPESKVRSTAALNRLNNVIATVRTGEIPELGESMTTALNAALVSNTRREPVKSWASKLAGSVFRR